MSSITSDSRNPVEALAEEFLERKRRGEDATPEEYAEKHPALADEILALFPALLMMEDLGGDSAERTGAVLTGDGAIAGTASGRRRAGWANSGCCARWAGAGWGSSTRRSRNR
jgi:hypothetical protein